jgi:hypothetical protein
MPIVLAQTHKNKREEKEFYEATELQPCPLVLPVDFAVHRASTIE